MTDFRLQRLDHVSLNVSDRPRSIGWYRDVLGLEPRGGATRDDWPVFMGKFGACVALFQAQSAAGERTPESAGLRHIAFMVERDDLRLAQARLREHGVEFRFEDHGNAHSVYFPDPDGNVIELTNVRHVIAAAPVWSAAPEPISPVSSASSTAWIRSRSERFSLACPARSGIG